jgi:hypothetical protein
MAALRSSGGWHGLKEVPLFTNGRFRDGSGTFEVWASSVSELSPETEAKWKPRRWGQSRCCREMVPRIRVASLGAGCGSLQPIRPTPPEARSHSLGDHLIGSVDKLENVTE